MSILKSANYGFVAGQLVSLALIIGALVAMPGAAVWSTTLSCAAVWGLASWCYRSTSARTLAGWWTLLVVFTLLAVGVVANVYVLTTLKGATTTDPYWMNSDMEEYFREGHYWYNDSYFAYWRRSRWGYGLLIALIWRVTTVASVVPPLIVNMLATLVSVVLSGVLTRTLLEGRVGWSAAKLQTAGMIATASVMYFLFSGTLLLREALIGLSVAAMGLGAVKLYRRQWLWGAVAYVAGAALMILIRSSWIPFVMLGLVAAVRADWRSVSVLGAVALLAVGGWWGLDMLFRDGGTVQYYNAKTIVSPHAFLYYTQSHEAFNAIFGEGYYEAEWYGKLARLPIAAAVQYLTPFPWAFAREIEVSPTLMFVKFTYPWYAIGGLIIYYLFGKIRRSPSGVARLALWGCLYWLVTVYVSAGSVPRYGVPLLPLMVPAVIYALATSWGTKPLKRWSLIYCSLLAVGLVGAYVVQNIKFS